MNKCFVLDFSCGEIYIIDYSNWKQEDLTEELDKYLSDIGININDCQYMFSSTAVIRFM